MWRLYSVLIAVVLLMTACGAEQSYLDEVKGAVIDPPRVLEDFSVLSTTGEDFTLSDHRGEVLLIYFGYRACPDFCPTTFAEMKRVYSDLNEPVDDVKIVFISIDPERDTIENLTLYTNAFHEDFIGLRPDEEQLASLFEQFGVTAEKRVVGESAMAYLYDHTATLFLVNPQGELEIQYLYGTPYRNIVNDVTLILNANS